MKMNKIISKFFVILLCLNVVGCITIRQIHSLPENHSIIKADSINTGRLIEIVKVDGVPVKDKYKVEVPPGVHEVKVIVECLMDITYIPDVIYRVGKKYISTTLSVTAEIGHVYSIRPGYVGEKDTAKVHDITQVIKRTIRRSAEHTLENTATLKTDVRGTMWYTRILDVDDVNPIDLGSDYHRSAWNARQTLTLLPGDYVITTEGVFTSGFIKKLWKSEAAQLKFSPEAGHSYLIKHKGNVDKHTCELWIEDLDTGEIVTEKITKGIVKFRM